MTAASTRPEAPRRTLPGTAPLKTEADMAAAMLAGLGAFLDREIAQADATAQQAMAQQPDGTLVPARAAKCAELARIIGVVDARRPSPVLELVTTTTESSLLAATAALTN